MSYNQKLFNPFLCKQCFWNALNKGFHSLLYGNSWFFPVSEFNPEDFFQLLFPGDSTPQSNLKTTGYWYRYYFQNKRFVPPACHEWYRIKRTTARTTTPSFDGISELTIKGRSFPTKATIGIGCDRDVF